MSSGRLKKHESPRVAVDESQLCSSLTEAMSFLLGPQILFHFYFENPLDYIYFAGGRAHMSWHQVKCGSEDNSQEMVFQ